MNIALTIATDDELQASELVALATGRATAKYVRYKHPDDNSSCSSSSSSSSGGVLSELVRDCDLVLSLLPATMHIPIAKEAIRQGKHLVTASYASQDMRRLDAEARAKGHSCSDHSTAISLHLIPCFDTTSTCDRSGVILLNEVGLDPGIDHMLVMRAVDSIHSRGGVVTNLVSPSQYLSMHSSIYVFVQLCIDLMFYAPTHLSMSISIHPGLIVRRPTRSHRCQ